MLLRLWTRALGELPAAEGEPPPDRFVWGLATVGAVALFLGAKLRPGVPKLADDTWFLLAYGVVPLLGAVWLDRRSRVGGTWGAGVLSAGATVAWKVLTPKAFKALVLRPWALLPGTAVALVCALVAAGRAGIDLRRWGLGLGDRAFWGPRLALGLAGVAVLVGVAALLSPAMLSYYPDSALGRSGIPGLVQAQAMALLYFIGWEFFFRGFVLFGLARRDPALAVIAQALPFFLMHRGKPPLEMASSWLGGVGLGWFTLRAGSVWPAVLLHWALTVVMEVVAFAVGAWETLPAPP